MIKEITFHTVPIASEETLRKVLDAFEAQHKIQVNLLVVPWDFYRQEFTDIALHHLKGDVVAMGTTATSDLIAMNSLRRFTKGEISALGGEESFLPSRWQSGKRPDSSDVWAIPFVADTRVIYFHRGLLARAGINEAAAFESPQQMERTIKQLRERGVDIPWFTFLDRFGVLHRVASWIWAYGGDLFTPDGKRVIFHEQEALEGMRAYFRLVPYMPASAFGQNCQDLIRAGKAAVFIDNAFMMFGKAQPEIGCVPVPGGSYVGGSDLAIWSHTAQRKRLLRAAALLIPPRCGRAAPARFFLPVASLERAEQTDRTTRLDRQSAWAGNPYRARLSLRTDDRPDRRPPGYRTRFHTTRSYFQPQRESRNPLAAAYRRDGPAHEFVPG